MECTTFRIPSLIALFLVVNGAMAQCYFPASSNGNDTVSFTYEGGSFASFGCAPIDPTFWFVGSGPWITATFSMPTDQPSFRVWGMNTDDSASVSVNGSAYAMNSLSATIGERVICGISPDPNGVIFSDGYIVGTSPANFSYQDITLNMAGVTSITVTGLGGAGWGFAGVSVDCPTGLEELTSAQFHLFPNPTPGLLHVVQPRAGTMDVTVLNEFGQVVLHPAEVDDVVDLSKLPAGIYAVTVIVNECRFTQRIVRS